MDNEFVAALLRQHPFAKGFWPAHIERLAELASEAHFSPGEVIFEEGDRSSFFYLLLEGNVALEVMAPGHPVRVVTLMAGEVLGWSSLTGDTGKQFQARALEPVHALAFDGTRLCHTCERDYAFGYRFLRATLSVLGDRLHAIRAQLLDVYSPVGQ